MADILPAWSAITDFAFAVVPWFFIWHMHMQIEERIGLGVAMSFGIVSVSFQPSVVNVVDKSLHLPSN